LRNKAALAPNCESVRTSFNNIFPTAFGVQLGNRLEPKLFKKVLKKVNEWHGFEDGRITALMSDMCDELKTDRLKRYQQNL
ncbi:hypothetical protein AB4570_25035, partial [Vibrio sp. 10N.222.49.F1]|uniref:hypothetical protein n=1 Tax=unclassified Vibrio TaxID=2614977 RepID=UPI00354F1D5E